MRRTAIPIAILVALIGAVMVMQYLWLTELATAARVRMERDLRVAVQATAGTIDLELHRERSTVRPGRHYVDLALDSAWVVDTLLPSLSDRIEANTELEVALALARIEPDGRERIVARTGSPPVSAPDAATPIFAPGGTQRLFFMRGDSARPDRAAIATWTTRGDNPTLAGIPPGAWELRAWHADGSLEQAAARLRLRNLAIGFGLMTLLAAAGAITLASYHRSRRLAEDRATILAGISHEARTPLAVIRSAADNLAGGVIVDPEAVAEYGRLIETEAERLTGVVEGALDFARVADDGRRGQERFDLGELVRATAEHAGQTRVRVAAPTRPAWLHGNRPSIDMAIRNLVANALAYSPSTSDVEVELHADGSHVDLIVADRGPGIAPEEQRRLFEPFQRGAAGAASGRGGLGLGLALASRVARLHGGTLTHRVRDGGGSLFVLSLPAAS